MIINTSSQYGLGYAVVTKNSEISVASVQQKDIFFFSHHKLWCELAGGVPHLVRWGPSNCEIIVSTTDFQTHPSKGRKRWEIHSLLGALEWEWHITCSHISVSQMQSGGPDPTAGECERCRNLMNIQWAQWISADLEFLETVRCKLIACAIFPIFSCLDFITSVLQRILWGTFSW